MTSVLLVTGSRSLATHPGAEACRRGWSTTCPGCNAEVDYDTCQCGDTRAAHDPWAPHGFYPLGCICYLRASLCDPRDRGDCATRGTEHTAGLAERAGLTVQREVWG